MGSLPDDFFPYQPPPRERTPTGEVRRVGIEVEFGSLGLDQALTIVASVLGGEIARASPSQGEVKGTPFGSFAVELDSKPLKDRAYLRPLASMGIEKGSSLADQIEASLLRVARELVPIEIVTPPIPWNRLHELNPLWPALRYAGAEDTRDSIFYAFGLHLNPETPDLEVETVLAIFRSYLLLESWIAEASEIDLTRRVTPYIRGFPEEYRRFVLRPEYAPDWPTFITDYVASNPTRNRPLDLLPLFRAASELDLSEQVENWPLVKARPAFHYRLPNCELAQSGWSPALDWNRWVVVERLANTKELLEELSNAYLESDDRMLLPGKSGWTERVHEKLPAIDEAARTS